MIRRSIIALFLTAAFLQHCCCQLPAGFNNYVDTVLQTFRVPGMCIAVVQNDTVRLTKGYGVKRLHDTAKVDEHTLFPIASNSKAFTAMALAILADEGKLKWDDPVINYLPWFKMSDAWVTSQVTIRDLLVHHSGIPAFAGDVLLFPPSTYTRKEILGRLKDIPIVNSFRTKYAYDNILYVAAGEVIAEVSGMSWEDFIQKNILDKAGMHESLSRFTDLKNKTNVATGHVLIQNTVTPVDEYLQQEIGDAGDPAGGVVSNANDMAEWMITELDSGKAAGQSSIIQSKDINELWKVVTPIPVYTVPASIKPAQMNLYGCALGVRVYNYGKYKIISHGGNLDGYVSHVLLVPDLKLGITVLTNQQSTGAYWSIIYHLLDYYMNNPSFNWIKGYKELLDSSLAEDGRDWKKAVIIPSSSAPKPIADDKYAGKYKDDFYGEITISKDATGLQFQFDQTPQFAGKLTPFQYETFTATFNNAALKSNAYLYFTIAPDGNVESCRLKVIDPTSDIGFYCLIFNKEK